MSTFLPAGAIVKVQVADAQTVAGFSGALNATDVTDAVSAYLNGIGFSVKSVAVHGNLLSSAFAFIQESFSADFQIEMKSSASTDAVESAVRDAFYEVTLQTPSQVTIPSFTMPDGSTSLTGQPSTTTVTQSILDTIKAAFEKITSGTTTLLAVAVGIVILVLVLAAYGPNVKHIAAAV